MSRGKDTGRILPRQELIDALESALSRTFGAPRRVRGLRRRISPYASSTRIEYLDIVLDHGRRLTLVLKDLSPAARLDAARAVRPAFLYDPLREIEMVRSALADVRWGTPRYYGHVHQPAGGRRLLFLERVRGPLLWQVGQLRDWERAAAWLARLHSRMQPSTLPRSCRNRLLEYDAAFYLTWPQRAEQHLRASRATPRELRRTFGRLCDRYDRVVDQLLGAPQTVIHGECYPANVIVRSDRRRGRTCPVDWELAARGPGVMDVAALMAGDWTDAERSRVLRAYARALEPRRGQPPSPGELAEMLAWCQLHLAVQMLGWSSGWTAPAAHRHDWVRTALRLAARLGLV